MLAALLPCLRPRMLEAPVPAPPPAPPRLSVAADPVVRAHVDEINERVTRGAIRPPGDGLITQAMIDAPARGVPRAAHEEPIARFTIAGDKMRLKSLAASGDVRVNGALLDKNQYVLLRRDEAVVQLGSSEKAYTFDGEKLAPRIVAFGRGEKTDRLPGRVALGDHGAISRAHAELDEYGRLTDLDTPNCTYVNGERVERRRRLVDGDIVRFANAPGSALDAGDTSFIFRNGDLRPMSHANARAVQKIFPQGVRASSFRQGAIGDCTFLAAFRATAANRPSNIASLVRAVDGDATKVRFAFNDRQGLRLQAMINDDVKAHGVAGDRGVRLMETAFGRSLKPRNDMETTLVLNEGGYAVAALQALNPGKTASRVGLGDVPLAQTADTRNRTRAVLQAIEKDPYGVIGTVSTLSHPPDARFLGNHAYAIEQVGENGGAISLVDPHDTRRPIFVTRENLLRNFRGLTHFDSINIA